MRRTSWQSFRSIPIGMTLFAMLMAGQAVGGQTTGDTVRVATFNVSLYNKAAGQVERRLADGQDAQARKLAEIIRSVRPDVLLLCEVDYDADGKLLDHFADRFLADDGDGWTGEAIEYPHRLSLVSNTGLPSGVDLNANDKTDDPEDAHGYGKYPGQYAFAILSRFPIQKDQVRTFQKFPWSEFPGALRPTKPDGTSYYSDEVWSKLRLSSKNHADIPIRVGDRILHVLASHPTPPVFDGPEDRNGARNHDEIDFWNHYLDGDERLVDDRGQAGGLPDGEFFVVAGDLNSDPERGDSRPAAIRRLLAHRRTMNMAPTHQDAAKKSINTTAPFGKTGMRVDYVIPDSRFVADQSGVYWPLRDQAGYEWSRATDHRLVWVDLAFPKSP
ncbi:MAG: endonuclease/exonuclease/phosphatase family protein [Planctomycetota bacterium]